MRKPMLIATIVALVVAALLAPETAGVQAASSFASPLFQQQWQQGEALTPNFWGPLANAHNGQNEPYQQASGGQRLVQYFDKGRMEITNGIVTNGLLATELVRGQVQIGDNAFQPKPPPAIPIAGDPDNTGPTYAQLGSSAAALIAPVGVQGGAITFQGIDANGSIVAVGYAGSGRERWGGYDDPTRHNLAGVFVDYRNRVGLQTIGYAISEPFGAMVKVAGQQRQVLIQLFERRVLTYTASNPDPFKVEMGNIGQHYYQWRYGGTSGGNPPATDLLQRIAAGEQLWQQAGITSYRITVRETTSGVGVITQVIVATVRGGMLVDQQLVQCTIGDHPCSPDAKLDPQTDVSVPGLFAYARANAANPNIDTTIEFDPTYGFPRSIQTVLRNAVDAAAGRAVTQFEPLP